MNPLLPFSAFVAGETGDDKHVYELYLNRVGINSIELPREKVTAEAGDRLRLKFSNRGAPIHITLTSSNAGMFTDFFHENMYVVDSTLFSIPIRKESEEGFFDLEILSGYGVTKTSLHVSVINPALYKSVAKKEEPPLQPVAHGRPHLLMVMMGISLILYTTWLYLGYGILNIAAFVTLIIGALYTWYRQQ
jgi:hypothetical protein